MWAVLLWTNCNVFYWISNKPVQSRFIASSLSILPAAQNRFNRCVKAKRVRSGTRREPYVTHNHVHPTCNKCLALGTLLRDHVDARRVKVALPSELGYPRVFDYMIVWSGVSRKCKMCVFESRTWSRWWSVSTQYFYMHVHDSNKSSCLLRYFSYSPWIR